MYTGIEIIGLCLKSRKCYGVLKVQKVLWNTWSYHILTRSGAEEDFNPLGFLHLMSICRFQECVRVNRMC